MANRRDLKKEINFLHYELISDCITLLKNNKKQSEDEVVDIVNKVFNARNTIATEINKPTSKMSKKEVKERYDKISNFILKDLDEAYESLSKLVQN